MPPGEEKRIERIEQMLFEEAKDSAVFRGEVREFMKNSSARADAVNNKANAISERQDAHEADLEAHGAGARNALTGRVFGALGAASGLGGLIGALISHFWRGH